MDNRMLTDQANKVVGVIRGLQASPSDWVDLARVGAPLAAAGIRYPSKLRAFLDKFQDILEFRQTCQEGKPPVYYVRPKREADSSGTGDASPLPSGRASHPVRAALPEYHAPERHADAGSAKAPDSPAKTPAGSAKASDGPAKTPAADIRLFKWAMIPHGQIEKLAGLAVEEKWYYGDTPPESTHQYPILKNYLAYTFKRLCNEKKVILAHDDKADEEYAAFNTGLVDRKYEYIYALFKRNGDYEDSYRKNFYWYLVAFAVAGEDAGKTLVNLFNPLPQKANYFGTRIENMLYDTSTGKLSCDYIHILTERTSRFPVDFFMDNCPVGFLEIDGLGIEDAAALDDRDEKRRCYFKKLGGKIKDDARILNRLKNRLDDAVEMALRKVEWNYKTAIPMYFPTYDTMSLLLPLALVDEEQVDLALVVERKQSGAYQGQTVLPLDLAYSNSRLVTRPDSDWLKTDTIVSFGSESSEND